MRQKYAVVADFPQITLKATFKLAVATKVLRYAGQDGFGCVYSR